MTKRPSGFFVLRYLIVLLLVLLTACSQSFLTGETEQLERLQGSLLVWHPFEGENAKIFTDFLDEFAQVHPEIQLLSEYIPQNELSTRFIKQAKAGLGPTMVIDFSRQIPDMARAKLIQPIADNTIDLSTYFPPTLRQILYQGEIYGLPLSSRIRVLCYNQAKLKQAKLTDDTDLSQPPSRLEGLIERSRKGYSVGMVSTFEDTFWGMGVFDAKFFDAQGLVKPQLEGWAKWLEWLKKANNEPNFLLIRSRDLLHEAFARGKLAYYVCNSTEIGDLKNDLKDNLRVAPLPAEPNQPATPILYTRVMMLNRSSSADETRLAMQLTQFMINPEQQLRGVIASQDFIPSNQKVRLEPQLFPIEAVLQKQSKTALAISLDDVESLLTILQEGDILYQKAIAGDITSSQAALQLSKVVKAQMKQNSGK